MPVRPQRATDAFGKLLAMYAFPTFIFYATRWIVETLFYLGQLLGLGSTPVLPYILGCLGAIGVTLFFVIPSSLENDPVKHPEDADCAVLLFSVAEMHIFIMLIISEIYGLSGWAALLSAIFTYPVTHLVMHRQFIALGSKPVELGYFLSVSCLLGIRVTGETPTDNLRKSLDGKRGEKERSKKRPKRG